MRQSRGTSILNSQISILSFCLMRISSWYLVASGWVDSRFAANAPLQSPDGASSPYGKATHDDLSVASLLRYSCHRFTTICASLRSFKLCSLVQLMFAATPEGEPRYLPAAKPLMGSPPFQRGMSRSDRGILMGLRRSRWTSTLNSQISILPFKP